MDVDRRLEPIKGEANLAARGEANPYVPAQWYSLPVYSTRHGAILNNTEASANGLSCSREDLKWIERGL
eukprot:9009488-Pyramimonas_sp.AAC.3